MNGNLFVTKDLSVNGNIFGGNIISYSKTSVYGVSTDITTYGNNYITVASTTGFAGFLQYNMNQPAVAVSETGQYIGAATGGNVNGNVYISNDYGTTFTAALTGDRFQTISMSLNAQYMIATTTGSGVWFSNNKGVSFSLISGISNLLPGAGSGTTYKSCSISDTGQYMFLGAGNGGAYYSNNYGASFTSVQGGTGGRGGMSNDGKYIAYCTYNGYFYLSINFGGSFVSTATTNISGLPYQATKQYRDVSVSTTGKYIFIIFDGGSYISTNSGSSFTTTAYGGGLTVAISYDEKIITYANGSNLYLSTDSATTFVQKNLPAYSSIALSKNGSVIVSGVTPSLYISTATQGFNLGPGYTNINNDTYLSSKLSIVGDLSLNSRLFVGGNAAITGTISKGGGSFDIVHPDPSRPEGSRLRHCFVEAPTRGDNMYRFKVSTSNLSASQTLPSYYKFLNENTQIWVSPINCLGAGYGVLQEDEQSINITVSLDGDYNVLVIGTRKDQMMIEYFDNAGGVEYMA
jgi:hypothetical protein